MKKKYIEKFLRLETSLYILTFIGGILNNFGLVIITMILLGIIQFIQWNRNNK